MGIGHDAEDGIGDSVEADGPAENVGGSAELALPQCVAEDDTRFVGSERAPQDRPHSENGEIVAGYAAALNAFRFALASQCRG